MVDRGSNRKVSKNHIGGVKVGRIALCVVDRGSTLSVVDRGSNRKVSKNHIGGVKFSRIALSMVDRGTNRRVSKNHITGVKVSRIECGRTWVKQKSIRESHRWCKG